MEIKEIGSEVALNRAIGQGLWLIDFSAPWCAPCRLQEPIMRRIASRFHGEASFGTVNIDLNPEMASNLDIRGVPTLVLFKNSKEVKRFVGLQSEEMLIEALKMLVNKSAKIIK